MPEADRQAPPGAPEPSSLHLHFGPNRLLQALPVAVAIAGATAILLSLAGWAWKIFVLVALGVSMIGLRSAGRKQHRSGVLALFPDGSACIKIPGGPEIRASLLDNTWTSRWISVVALIEPQSSRHYYCVVCAAENLPGEYRRLLKFLHMRTSPPENHKVSWS